MSSSIPNVPATFLNDSNEHKRPTNGSLLDGVRYERMTSGDTSVLAKKNEVRSIAISSRPIFHKPAQLVSSGVRNSQKPKLVLPKQLQQLKKSEETSGTISGSNDTGLVTQTVYGFLDFVTTVGNTVMIFTPQTKGPSGGEIQPTTTTTSTGIHESSQASEFPISDRTPRILDLEENDDPMPFGLEASEVSVRSEATDILETHPVMSSFEFVELNGDTSSTESHEPPRPPSIVTSQPEIRTHVNVVTAVKVSSSESTKGFTLKFSKNQPPNTLTLKGHHSPNVETRIQSGVTAIHETKILGIATTLSQLAITATPTSLHLPPTATATLHHLVTKNSNPLESFSERVEVITQRSVSSSGDLENGEKFHEHFFENLDGLEEILDIEPSEVHAETEVIKPSATTSSQDTPKQFTPLTPKEPPTAQIYASPIPSPNAYSRQPQIYVDVSPVKSYDYVVTATPTRKPFRPQNLQRSSTESNRFSNRFSKLPPSSTETNDLIILPYESSTEDPRRGNSSNRLRNNRNRSSFKLLPEPTEIQQSTVSVYGNTATATSAPARKFSRGRSSSVSSVPPVKEQEFKLAGRKGFAPGATKHVLISPTSSTSVYRFKLNRPTGRWRFKPSPKPKVNIIKTKEEEVPISLGSNHKEILQASQSGSIYPQGYNDHGEPLTDLTNAGEESKTETNELGQDLENELTPQTIRVATLTPTEFIDFDSTPTKFLEIATIRSPYVFQAGNVKNTRYITVTKTFTKEIIQPTQASSLGDQSLENILGTRPPYERILEGSNNIATLPLITLGTDTATPPLETVTQTFSTTQVMLKTSLLPVLYDGVTTMYTLTQSYFVTRLVTAHKTVPPMELFHFVPTKALTEFNTALQEAGSEHREQLLGSESEDDNETNYEHIVAPPDELTSVGSEFDLSSMEEKYPKKTGKVTGKSKLLDSSVNSLPDFGNLTPEQIALLRYFSAATSGRQQAVPQHLLPMPNPLQNYFQSPPILQSLPAQHFPVVQFASSPVVFNTVTTLVETKTLRLQFGSKPTQTTIYSTKIVPTKVTTYVTASLPQTQAIPNFFQAAPPYPLAYVG